MGAQMWARRPVDVASAQRCARTRASCPAIRAALQAAAFVDGFPGVSLHPCRGCAPPPATPVRGIRPEESPRSRCNESNDSIQRHGKRGSFRTTTAYNADMCLCIYLASDERLPDVPRSKTGPAFSVAGMHRPRKWARARFSYPHIYRVGAAGCACGFLTEDPVDEKVRQSRGRLAEYLRIQLDAGRSMELFACWVGDEREAPNEMRQLVPEDLLTDNPSFVATFDEQPEWYQVVSSRIPDS